jgi:DNA invertase Pin-like site-specific DNA recombinase
MNATAAAKGHLVGYVRVSSLDQNTDRQLDGLQLDKVFTDKASGKDTKRPQLQAALDHLREGDTLVVHSMDRLARNLADLLGIVKELTERGVKVQFVKEGQTFTGESNHTANLMLALLGAVAEFERSMIKERQREGIAIAKSKGVYKGGKPKLTPEQVREVKARAAAGESRTKLAKEYGISRPTLYAYLSTAQ